MTLNSVGYARIAVIVNPENFINESINSNNDAVSLPFIVRLPGNATTVPTPRRPGTPPAQTVAQQSQNQARIAAAARRAARLPARAAATAPKKLHRKRPRSGKIVTAQRERRRGTHQAPDSGVRCDQTVPLIPSMRNPHNPSIFRRFVRLSDTIAGNLRQN